MCFPQVPPHSEQVFRMSLKPELVTTFLTTAGVMLDSFHLKSFLSSAGKDDTDTSLWWTKFMVGGTLENKDRLRGGADIWTSAVLIAQAFLSWLLVFPPDPVGVFSLSPSEKDSKFSPTNEGVFEQTEDPFESKNEQIRYHHSKLQLSQIIF